MKRFIEKKITKWLLNNDNKAFLIEGARQVGKTYTIRKVLNENKMKYFEINFIERPDILRDLVNINDAKSIIEKLKLISGLNTKENNVIFLDEIQEYPEIVTKIKFLVERNDFKFIMSGSLLGIELKGVKSIPVGYIEINKMYPMNFYEFIYAFGVNENIIKHIKECYQNKTKVDSVIHQRMMELFNKYLIIGGMPSVVLNYINNSDLNRVREEQQSIINAYKRDFSKYENIDRRLRIISIYDNIPSQLNKKNYKFIFSYLDKQLKFNRYENSFLWLVDSGVSLPTYNVSSLESPLLMSKDSSSFKLFMSDVGLLMSNYPTYIRDRLLLNNDETFNKGMLYESFVCQELSSLGFKTYYYLNKKIGEIDFLVDDNINIFGIEVKSGKSYKTHTSLNRIKEINPNIKFMIFTNYNVEVNDNIYLPIYMVGFLDLPNK